MFLTSHKISALRLRCMTKLFFLLVSTSNDVKWQYSFAKVAVALKIIFKTISSNRFAALSILLWNPGFSPNYNVVASTKVSKTATSRIYELRFLLCGFGFFRCRFYLITRNFKSGTEYTETWSWTAVRRHMWSSESSAFNWSVHDNRMCDRRFHSGNETFKGFQDSWRLFESRFWMFYTRNRSFYWQLHRAMPFLQSKVSSASIIERSFMKLWTGSRFHGSP